MKLNVLFLGKCDYDRALDIQYNILEKRQKDELGDTLILVEHPPVITIGRNGKETNVVASEEYLKSQGIAVFDTNRGGDVTYHGPGQIVGYPIIKLNKLGIGVRDFVKGLEEIFIKLIKDTYNIEAGRDTENTGVWIGNDKITAIGLAVKRGVTMHGFAFNVNTILEHFLLIVPCGITGKGVTSIEKLSGKKEDFEEMNKRVLAYFCREFGYDGYEEMKL
ncbi:MAG: lipoyl(octanoyl) transferase LipB [Lutisporaceae bacterium]